MLIDLATIQKSGTFVIGCGNHVLIVSSKNIVTYLLNVVNGIELKARHIDDLFVQHLRNGSLTMNKISDRWDNAFLQRTIDEWVSKGYTLYKQQRKGTSYKVIYRTMMYKNTPIVVVLLKKRTENAAAQQIPVGVFTTLMEAEHWVKNVFPDDVVYDIIKCDDEWNKEVLPKI